MHLEGWLTSGQWARLQALLASDPELRDALAVTRVPDPLARAGAQHWQGLVQSPAISWRSR